jgi:hypothetical protein
MAGVFNDQWNVYKNTTGAAAFGGQLSYAADGVSAYLNFMDGKNSGTIVDLTASFQITKEFKLGVNAADYSNTDDMGYTGFALYPSYAFSDAFALGIRAEYFSVKKGSVLSGIAGDQSVTAFTLSGNYKLGSLTVIPEFRTDGASANSFKSSGSAVVDTKSASQLLLALVYGF